ncbi:phospholipase/Carboxylesterase [Isosphaera pallida ATCC 43644]|uniref:Phospholipase/Carboxylesterase n=1 Tax=Isosphaera pallida (strain ATCC 43644 / DSM 9630 / IS1B) TaxID=575540 RepID=E8R297_ISOPI|nr:phospholipase/carboxylesterase [Isosphaera pallida]ADV63527.1 phospholipase/Carboxylesterase [Isosphaera pallida ATCC 43644]
MFDTPGGESASKMGLVGVEGDAGVLEGWREDAELCDPLYIPRSYEPNYAYPLLTLLHDHGGSARAWIEAMPAISRRNHLGVALRGPWVSPGSSELGRCDWGVSYERPRPNHVAETADRPPREETCDVVRFRGVCQCGEEGFDDRDLNELLVFQAVRRVRRLLHVHSERVFLVGAGQGAAVALDLGLRHPDRFAGVVAINGWLPRVPGLLKRFRDLKGFPILWQSSQFHPAADLESDLQAVRLLSASGCRVEAQSHATRETMNARMLSEIDRWVLEQFALESPVSSALRSR